MSAGGGNRAAAGALGRGTLLLVDLLLPLLLGRGLVSLHEAHLMQAQVVSLAKALSPGGGLSCSELHCVLLEARRAPALHGSAQPAAGNKGRIAFCTAFHHDIIVSYETLTLFHKT